MQSATHSGERARGQLWGRVVCQAPECGYSEAGFVPALARLLRQHQSATGHSVAVTADSEADPADPLRRAGLNLATVRLRAATLVRLATSHDAEGFERLLREWGSPEA